MSWDTDVLSPKPLRLRYDHPDGTTAPVLHERWCPGCNGIHQIAVEQPLRNGARWSFDGSCAAPTYFPSVNVNPGMPSQCHYFIRTDCIEFCVDSPQTLAGRTVDLPDTPSDWLT